MRKIFLSMMAAAVFIGCEAQQDCEVNVKLEGLNGKVEFAIVNEQQSEFEKRDTLTVKDGAFTYSAKVNSARVAQISTINPKDGAMIVYLVPGETLNVEGSWNGEYHLSGSDLYKDIDAATSISAPYQKKMQAISQEFQQREAAGEDQKKLRDELEPKFMALVQEMTKKEGDYIAANPNSAGSVVLLSNMDDEDFEKFSQMLSESAKTGPLASVYNVRKEAFNKMQQRKDNEKKLSPGNLAPDFRLPSIDGKTLALSDLRGKFVVIDFWGSWCGWCIKGMPEMKKYYEKYAGKLEILGVDCGDTEDKWKAAVEKQQLPWKHVRNSKGKDDITVVYAIQGFPTKILIDPEGKIVKTIVGEDPAFYSALDEVLQAK